MHRLAPLLALVAVAVGCNSDDSPPPTASFLSGGRDAFEARVEKAGKPVVVNKWASWCGPCRLEFPFFREQAEKHGGDILFVGVNSNDNRADAEQFLEEEPVPFKHFEDPKLEIAASFDAVQAFPATAFYNSRGELEFVHQGGYSDEETLAKDIERYAR